MWVRCALVVVVAILLASCVPSGGPPLSSTDKLFLEKVEELGANMSSDDAQTTALAVGRAFCDALRSGATPPQAHETLYASYPAVSLQNIHDATAAANLIYCPETPP
jgi:hypothetical protein